MKIMTMVPAFLWDNNWLFVFVASLPGLGSLRTVSEESRGIQPVNLFPCIVRSTFNYLCQWWAPLGHIFHLVWGMLGLLIAIHLTKRHLGSFPLNWFLKSWSTEQALYRNSEITFATCGSQLMQISCKNKYERLFPLLYKKIYLRFSLKTDL